MTSRVAARAKIRFFIFDVNEDYVKSLVKDSSVLLSTWCTSDSSELYLASTEQKSDLGKCLQGFG